MKKLLFVLTLSLGFIFNMSAQATKAKGVVLISAEKFKNMAETNRFPIIDIRTAKEFEVGHIEGAINIDFYKKDFYGRMAQYKNKPFIYYCRSGNRTGHARKKFNEMKFKEGYELEHGTISWNRAGFKLVK